MNNTFWAGTGLMDDYGFLIDQDIDGIDQAARSLTCFFWND